jgi:hypothetical protein
VKERHTRFRHAFIAAAVILLIVLGTNSLFVLSAVAQQAATLTATNSPQAGAPGSVVTFQFTIQNNTTVARQFSISVDSLPSGLTPATPAPVSVPINGTASFQAQINIASNTAPGTYSGIRVTASSSESPSLSVQTFITVQVTGSTFTPVPSNTPVPTSTSAPTFTPTPGPGCPDNPDPGDDMGSAKLLLVNVPENHGICAQGDIDFFKFGGVGGKVYTIDITQMDAGLDLALDLYDDKGRLLTSNDDFYLHAPTPTPVTSRATPIPLNTDLRPRIDSFRVPYNGLYYVRVRDSLNVGGQGKAYTIVVQGESYGPTPATVTEICRDLYEEDGLPEEATLITSNEVQPKHVLCPTGDADWVKFFAKAGKTYYLYTDSRPYKNNPDVNDSTEAGADTVLYLFDRDGVSLITFNDDIQSSDANLQSLDSEVRFVPTVDGFYYAQVKNTGDIGNQFIEYDLVMKLCLPGQECGRGPAPVPAPGISPTSEAASTTTTTTAIGTSTTPSATEISFGDETATAETGGSAPLNALDAVGGPVNGFADTAFQAEWMRSDRPVAEQRATRSWLWGPSGLVTRSESYAQAASGMRQVQYFDKGRMEMNNPAGNRNSRWFVTSGLLVKELISGRMQVGDNEFVQRHPADVPIAGDANDSIAPNYGSFAGVTGQTFTDRTGQQVMQQIDRAGHVSDYTGPRRAAATLARFVPETGHNIAQAFWTYMNEQGTVYENGSYHTRQVLDWVFTLGYPISEPYWTHVRVGGVERDVLVQVFERRVLTYSPDNPSQWQVEMGNVGRHYYLWRYGENLPS